MLSAVDTQCSGSAYTVWCDRAKCNLQSPDNGLLQLLTYLWVGPARAIAPWPWVWRIWWAVVGSTHMSKHTPEKPGCSVIQDASLLGSSVCSSDISSSISVISRQQTLSLAVGIAMHFHPHEHLYVFMNKAIWFEECSPVLPAVYGPSSARSTLCPLLLGWPFDRQKNIGIISARFSPVLRTL